MLTELGKYLRRYRINNGLLLKDMANALNITPAYLSAIENGKRPPTTELINKIEQVFHFTENETKDLMDTYYQTINEITINTKSANDKQTDLGLVFARKIDSLSDEQISKIYQILRHKNADNK